MYLPMVKHVRLVRSLMFEKLYILSRVIPLRGSKALQQIDMHLYRQETNMALMFLVF